MKIRILKESSEDRIGGQKDRGPDGGRESGVSSVELTSKEVYYLQGLMTKDMDKHDRYTHPEEKELTGKLFSKLSLTHHVELGDEAKGLDEAKVFDLKGAVAKLYNDWNPETEEGQQYKEDLQELIVLSNNRAGMKGRLDYPSSEPPFE